MELSKASDIKKIVVIGAGRMGSQIAEVAASHLGNCKISMTDINDEFVNKGLTDINQRLDKFFVAKGKMTEEQKKDITSRIEGTSDLTKAVSDSDFVIEAALEEMKTKKEIFRKLDESAPPHAILATNTSYLSITEIGSLTKRQDKIVGTHFFNPVSVMKLVEVVKGALTSDSAVEISCELMRNLEKEPVVCPDSSYGFLVNRATYQMRVEAVQMLWERLAPPWEIDKAIRLGANFPMGPLELGDYVGSWGIYAMAEDDRIREVGSEKGRLHPLLRLMVRAGYIGGPGNKGIYDFWKDVLSKQQ